MDAIHDTRCVSTRKLRGSEKPRDPPNKPGGLYHVLPPRSSILQLGGLPVCVSNRSVERDCARARAVPPVLPRSRGQKGSGPAM